MNIKSLEAFITIAKGHTITQASRALFLSQSAVSIQLSSLETELGYRLFTRKKGKLPLQLTERAKQFLPIAQKMLELYNEGLHLKNDDSCQLTFAGVDTVNSYLLPPFFSAFARQNRNVKLHVLTLNSDEVLDMVESGIADLGFVFSPEKRSSNLVIEPFYTERFYMVMCRENPHPGTIGTIDPQSLDFSREVCLWMGDSYLNWRSQWQNANQDGYMRVYTLELLLKLLNEDGLWGTVPQLIVDNLAQRRDFTVCEYTSPPPDRVAYKVKKRASGNPKKDVIDKFENEMDNFIKQHNFLELM